MSLETFITFSIVFAVSCCIYAGSRKVEPEEVARYALTELLLGMSGTTLGILMSISGALALQDGKPYVCLAYLVFAGYLFLMMWRQAKEIDKAFANWNHQLHNHHPN